MKRIEPHDYVPILKGKKGEFDALRLLPAEARAAITPLIEIVPITWDFRNKTYKRELDEHLVASLLAIEAAWGAGQTIWLDTLWSYPSDNVDGVLATDYLMDFARGRLRAVPVGGPRRAASHTASVAAAHAADKRGVVLRLDPEDLASDQTGLVASIAGWLEAVGVEPEQVDLLADFQVVTSAGLAASKLSALTVLSALPHLNRWRSFTVASGAFPLQPDVRQHSIKRLPRNDWSLWSHIDSEIEHRRPAYADFAIAHPGWRDLDPDKITPSVSIRYATPNDWLIVKEGSVKKGFEQFHKASDRLTRKKPPWRGMSHCDACRFIEACAVAGEGPGNLTTWRQVGNLHHFQETIDQLANRP